MILHTDIFSRPAAMRFYEGDGTGGGGGAAAGGAATPAPTFSFTNSEGAFLDGWLDRMPEGLRDNPSLKVVGTLPDLAKSYVETKAMIGKRLEMPGEGATADQITSWRKTVGAPETAEGYMVDGKSLRPEGIPEEAWDVNGEKAFLAIAHKHHLAPAAVKDILGYYGKSVADGLTKVQADEAQNLAAEGTKLKQAWGAQYDANLSLASRVAQTVGLDPKTHPIFQSAEVVQAFAKLGALFSEDKLVSGDKSGISGSIRDRIRDISDPNSSSPLARDYRGENGPERQAAAQAQLHQLYAANGQQ